jgi:hypothetical protein
MRNWKLPVFATLAYLLAGSLWILAGHFLSGTFYPSDGFLSALPPQSCSLH